MDALTPIPRANFLRLVSCSKAAFLQHRSRGEMPLWFEACAKTNLKSTELTTTFYDALVFETASSFVAQGPSWSGVRLALPGMQIVLRDGLDREVETFAAISLPSVSQLLVGAGTLDELRADGVLGRPCPAWIMPISIVVDHLRRRAAEYGIVLPENLAPPPSEMPAWAVGRPAWPSTVGGARVQWSLNANTAQQFAVAPLM